MDYSKNFPSHHGYFGEIVLYKKQVVKMKYELVAFSPSYGLKFCLQLWLAEKQISMATAS